MDTMDIKESIGYSVTHYKQLMISEKYSRTFFAQHKYLLNIFIYVAHQHIKIYKTTNSSNS